MAIFHMNIQVMSKGKGKSAVGASAYRSGELLEDETGRKFDYTHKSGIVESFIMLPSNAPAEYTDRGTLWRSVQEVEKAKNAQVAREVEVALPVELSRAEQRELVREFALKNFVAKGMVADIAIHDKRTGNPHAHIMLTTRPLTAGGKWGDKEKKDYARDKDGSRIPVLNEDGTQRVTNGRKVWKRETVETTGWNNRDNAEIWRESWATMCNERLTNHKVKNIDHRSYKRQGVNQEPTRHVGAEKKKESEYGRELREAREESNARVEIRNSQTRQDTRGREASARKELREATRAHTTVEIEQLRTRAEALKHGGILEAIKRTVARLGAILRQERHQESKPTRSLTEQSKENSRKVQQRPRARSFDFER